MAHFYSSIEGNRGEATRCGSKASGITGHIRGWGNGVRVDGHVEKFDGKDTDVFYVYATGGSKAASKRVLIAKVIDGVSIDQSDPRW